MRTNRYLLFFVVSAALASPLSLAGSDDDTCSKACDTYGQAKQASGDEDFKDGFKQAAGSVFHGANNALFCGCAFNPPSGHRVCVNSGGSEEPMSSCQNVAQSKPAATASQPAQPAATPEALSGPGDVDFGAASK